MSPFTPFVSQTFSILTIIGQAIIVLAIIIALFFRKQTNNRFLNFVSDRSIFFAFIVALMATCGSLFYSEIAHFTPCELCWFQRIFMYPQVILLGIALIQKDKGIRPYSIAMSVIGACFALYNYMLQLGAVGESACSVNGGPSCAEKVVFHFGYITIATMALTAFLLIITFMVAKKK